MGTMEVRHKEGEVPAKLSREWEPLRMVRDLLGWEPFREWGPMFHRSMKHAELSPDFDIKESKDGYVLTADLPGIKESDVEVSVTGSRLTVRGKREHESKEQSETYYVSERSFGSFARSFQLPEGVDAEHIQAELKSGVLSVTIPNRAEVQSKKVPVNPAGKS